MALASGEYFHRPCEHEASPLRKRHKDDTQVAKNREGAPLPDEHALCVPFVCSLRVLRFSVLLSCCSCLYGLRRVCCARVASLVTLLRHPPYLIGTLVPTTSTRFIWWSLRRSRITLPLLIVLRRRRSREKREISLSSPLVRG